MTGWHFNGSETLGVEADGQEIACCAFMGAKNWVATGGRLNWADGSWTPRFTEIFRKVFLNGLIRLHSHQQYKESSFLRTLFRIYCL